MTLSTTGAGVFYDTPDCLQEQAQCAQPIMVLRLICKELQYFWDLQAFGIIGTAQSMPQLKSVTLGYTYIE